MENFEDGCEHCLDPDGVPCLPQYGLAPHAGFTDLDPETYNSVLKFTREEYDHFLPEDAEGKTGTWFCPTEGCPNSKALHKDGKVSL